MRPNIKLSLFKLRVLQLLALLNNVIEKLTANAAVFATPPITLLAMQALSNKFTTDILAATNGGVADRKERDKVVLELRSTLRIQADYVRSICNGDAALLALSGFELSKMPVPIKEVGIPQRLLATPTDESGTLLVRWGKAVGARMYRLEQATSDPALGATTWNPINLTGRQRVVVSDLEPYIEYFFRVIAIGITHEGLPSDIVVGRSA